MDGLFYAYTGPRSTEREKFLRDRAANLAQQQQQRQQALKEGKLSEDSAEFIEWTVVDKSPTSRSAGEGRAQLHKRQASDSHGAMDPTRLRTSSSSGSSSANSEQANRALLNNPYELRHGRRYLREVPYPLPCDLPEIQRQNLRTLLGCTLFGKPVCAPNAAKNIPNRVLEIGCGSGYWSSMCHDYFCSLGHKNVAFTGLDLAPLAPDLNKQGLTWNFVQHDLRRTPLPFDDGEFDMVMLKDLSLVFELGVPFEKFLDESMRVLGENGTLELWESDHVLRSLLPHPPASKLAIDREIATRTATFPIGPGTPFAPAQNKYIQRANVWIQEALDRRKLPPLPCSRVAQVLYQEPDLLGDIGIRRIAIPLSEQRWEREPPKNDSSTAHQKEKARSGDLTPEQAAIRQTALMTVLQKIESLEPLLKEVSGKNSEEWSHWWASMMSDLLDSSRGSLTGECLEAGAWWATKLAGGD
ncbi:hypothetical protein KC330_g5968 [Hortaea werneckii]|nr:hypothetical protein KC330_g5968 [Hortaea werneckii]